MLKLDTFDDKINFYNNQTHREFYSPRHPVILIEGYDGSGKSTLAENVRLYFEKDFSSKLFKEPVVENSIREIVTRDSKFFEFFKEEDNIRSIIDDEIDCVKYFLFMASRAVNLTKICNHISYDGIAIMERSFPSTMLYQRNLDLSYNFDIIKENVRLFRSYEKMYNFSTLFDSPDLILFLDINPQTCINRLKDRELDNMDPDLTNANRIQEDITYYRRIMELIDNVTSSKVVFINGNNDEKDVRNSVISEIESYIHSYRNNDFFQTERIFLT